MLATNPVALSIALSYYNGYLNAGKILRDAALVGNLESTKILWRVVRSEMNTSTADTTL